MIKHVRLNPRHGKGKELQELLRKELAIPELAKWFEIRFATDELVTVKCEYFPAEEVNDDLRG